MIIDGKKEAAALREEIKKEIISIKSKTNKAPGLTVILIGEFAPSLIYVRNKEKNSKEVGINSNVIKYSNDVKEEEVFETLHDLRNASVEVVTIGQYLQPSKKHLPVKSFISPSTFEKYEAVAKDLGFRHVESGPLVRSSYKAHKHVH